MIAHHNKKHARAFRSIQARCAFMRKMFNLCSCCWRPGAVALCSISHTHTASGRAARYLYAPIELDARARGVFWPPSVRGCNEPLSDIAEILIAAFE